MTRPANERRHRAHARNRAHDPSARNASRATRGPGQRRRSRQPCSSRPDSPPAPVGTAPSSGNAGQGAVRGRRPGSTRVPAAERETRAGQVGRAGDSRVRRGQHAEQQDRTRRPSRRRPGGPAISTRVVVHDQRAGHQQSAGREVDGDRSRAGPQAGADPARRPLAEPVPQCGGPDERDPAGEREQRERAERNAEERRAARAQRRERDGEQAGDGEGRACAAPTRASRIGSRSSRDSRDVGEPGPGPPRDRGDEQQHAQRQPGDAHPVDGDAAVHRGEKGQQAGADRRRVRPAVPDTGSQQIATATMASSARRDRGAQARPDRGEPAGAAGRSRARRCAAR